MYKIMVVDDEAIVREGIKERISWAEHGFKLTGDYANGREALEAIERDKPDIVLSDICMPQMDGLELTRHIQGRYPFIKVIILTGHDDFDYAQQALRLKAYDFILKPITANELRTLLDKLKLELDEETHNREDLTRLQLQLNESLPLLKERFLERLVTTALPEEEIRERLSYFRLPALAPGGCLALVVDIDDFGMRQPASTDTDIEMLRFAGFNILQEVLREMLGEDGGIAFRTREERMVIVLAGRTDDALYETAYALAEEVRHSIEKYLRFTVTAGVGRAAAGPEQLPQSYRSAVAALDYRFLLGKNRVISILDMEGKHTAQPGAGTEWSRKLSSGIKTGTLQDVHALIGQLLAELKTSMLPLEACYLHIQKAVVALMNTIQELGGNELAFFTEHGIALTDIYRFKTLDELEGWLKDVCGKAVRYMSEQRSDYTKLQLLQATAYIGEHYKDEELSLQQLCRHVGMSASYFCAVFKQHTGETFVEYVTRTRMLKAKELLQHTPLKSYEIAAQVGYADPNYFSVLFKKHCGASPTEYRDKLLREKA
ncbi:response regulator [Paenibacillus sp. MBLB4367]|uniref:response regulator n=1 Tax=Paenibacillus sp. MBLB4367 TaxID=3384767 RepID=UPI0039081A83